METASIKQIRDELKIKSEVELVEICLRLARYKKESKELLTYVLFESDDEKGFVFDTKEQLDEEFRLVNRANYYVSKKGIQKIYKNLKKLIRFSNVKETEVDLLIYFCQKLKDFTPSIKYNTVLMNLYNRQIIFIDGKLQALHPDLQYDYMSLMDELRGRSE